MQSTNMNGADKNENDHSFSGNAFSGGKRVRLNRLRMR
jgi:hypothetical protein